MSDSEEIERLRARVSTATQRTGGPMSDDRPQTLDEAWKQIDRLHLRIITLEIEIEERQHDRITALEAENAILRGTLSRYDATEDDQPIVIHDVPGNAPR